MNRRKLLALSLVASALTFGCNLPGNVSTDQPRVVVNYGNLNLAPNADLAIVLDLRALLGTGFKVQQVAPGSSVQKVTAKVTGPNLAQPVTTSVSVMDCQNGLATLNFTQLPPGPVDIAVNAVDATGQVVSWAIGSAVIKPGQTATVTLRCSTDTGGLTIKFDCPEGCAGATPSPTPTPTPTPSPANPTAAGLTSHVIGLMVDDSENVYLMATDPQYTGAEANYPPDGGRIIKVPANLSSNGSVFFDTVRAPYQGIYDNGVFYIADWFGVRELNTAGTQMNANPIPTAFGVGAQAIAKDHNGMLWANCQVMGCQLYVANFPTVTQYWVNNPLTSCIASPMTARAFTFDAQNRPIWSSQNGILTAGDNPKAMPVVLAANPSASLTGGFSGLDTTPQANVYLTDAPDDTKVYLWNQGDKTNFSNIAYTFNGEYPRHIVHSASGKYYVLTYNTLPNGVKDNTKYRVYRADLVNNALTNVQQIVTSY